MSFDVKPDRPPHFHALPARAGLPAGGVAEVGNKAWNLMRMAASGLAVPPGFVLPVAWCRRMREAPDAAGLRAELAAGISALEAATQCRFGAARRPLLVSVR